MPGSLHRCSPGRSRSTGIGSKGIFETIRCICAASRRAVFGYDQRIEVFGSKGGIEAFNESPCQVRLRTRRGERAENPLYFFLERYQRTFVAELEAFIGSIREDLQPTVTGRDGLIPVLIGIAANRSMSENRPIRVEVR